jgi:spermidine/putrescine transport system permease protein
MRYRDRAELSASAAAADSVRSRFSALALVPAAAWLTLFFLVPLAIIGVISLMRPGAPVEWTLDGSAYRRLIDPLHLEIVARSVGLAVVATLLCLLLGYPLAWFIARRPPRARRILYFLVLIPLWANSLILIYAWMVLLRPNGVFEQLLRAAGFGGEEPLAILYTPAAVLIGLVYWYLPFMVYPLYAAIEKLDFTLLDAARDLGASRRQLLVRVLLPLTRPGIATGCLLVFIESLGAFVVPDLLGGGKSMMLGNLIQQRFLSVPQDWPLGAAIAAALLATMAAAMVLVLRLNRGRA